MYYGGHKAYKSYEYGGHPAPAGPALPNLINAVSILKSKSKSKSTAFGDSVHKNFLKNLHLCIGMMYIMHRNCKIRVKAMYGTERMGLKLERGRGQPYGT